MSAEHRNHNIQTNIIRATAAITQMADMVLVADQGGKMADSKKLIRSALDGVIFLGQAQSLLNDGLSQNEVADQLNIKRNTFAKAVQAQRLHVLKKKIPQA